MPEALKSEYQYIHFVETDSPKRKTRTFDCVNNDVVTRLGEVKWSGGWRQYCFFPAENCMFSKGCLGDVNDFITQLMAARK